MKLLHNQLKTLKMKPQLIKSKAYLALSINQKINLKNQLKNKQKEKRYRVGEIGLFAGLAAFAISHIIKKKTNPDCNGQIAVKIMEKPKIYSRNKSQFPTEQAALESVCKKENLQPEQLTADHSEKKYRWTAKNAETATASKQFPYGLHTVERTGADNDLQNAKRAAMEHFNTFEANIKRVESEEDETHFVFTKVRG